MTITVTLNGQPVAADSVSIAITSSAPAAPVLTVGPGKQFATIAAAAAAATPGCTIAVDPGTYRESVHFTVPLTIASSVPGTRPVIDVTGLALVLDQAALLFDADYTVNGLEIRGATGVNSTNAAAIRNNAGNVVNGTILNCDLHHCQTNVLHTGGTLTVTGSDIHHNTGDGQSHLLYCAQFGANVPTLLTLANCRIWHSANGNAVKSNAKSVVARGCTVGTIAVPAGTSVLRPGDPPGNNPAWMGPPPGAGQEWLIYHVDAGVPCCSNGYPYSGNAFDLGQGGAFDIESCIIFSGGASEYMLSYGYESTTNGNAGGTIKGCTFYIERSPTAIGNRVPNSVIAISGCQFVGTYLPTPPLPPTKLDCTDVTGKAVPGAVITLAPSASSGTGHSA